MTFLDPTHGAEAGVRTLRSPSRRRELYDPSKIFAKWIRLLKEFLITSRLKVHGVCIIYIAVERCRKLQKTVQSVTKFCDCVCLSLFVCLPVCLSLSKFVCLFVCLLACLFVCLFVCLFLCFFVSLFLCLWPCIFVPSQVWLFGSQHLPVIFPLTNVSRRMNTHTQTKMACAVCWYARMPSAGGKYQLGH